jgi:hypothetical protein
VDTKVIEGNSVILIEQANPQVVYVPSYDPMIVYGAPFILILPFTIRRRDTTPQAWQFLLASASRWERSGVGVGAGAAAGAATILSTSTATTISIATRTLAAAHGNGGRNNIGGGNRPSNPIAGGGNRGGIGGGNRGDIGGGNRASTLPAGGGGAGDRWQHNPQHRGGTPYRDRATADRFGGTARGDSLSNRQASARQQVGRQGGNLSSARRGGAGRAIARVQEWAIGRVEAGQIALEVGMSRVAGAETATPSEEDPGGPKDTTDRALAPAAAAAHPAWDLAVAGAVVAAVGGADDVCLFEEKKSRSSK